MEKKLPYHPEKYWSEVSKKIKSREDGKNVVAGDDEPYYRYKRRMFLSLLRNVDFSNSSVLEIGSGPGGNILEIVKLNPKRLVGVDISNDMINLAKDKVPSNVELIKINGEVLPFKDNELDIVFSATVLQHNTDESMLINLINEMSRVSANKVYLFERIENSIKGDDLCLGRPVSYYENLFENNGFKLVSKKFINIRVSYFVCGIIRKVFNPRSRKEGDDLTKLSLFLQKITLPVTKILDKIFLSNKDLARLEFDRIPKK